jgi:NitT/TauT family transport system substrate-binding protein
MERSATTCAATRSPEMRMAERHDAAIRMRAAVLGALMLLAACSPGPAGGGGPTSASAPAPSGPAPTGRAAYPAPNDEEIKLRASWCAVAGAMFPLWIAKEAGIFQRHRLDVELIYAFGAEANIAALFQRDLDFVECAGASVVPGMMASSEIALIANFLQGNPYRLITVPDIQRVADLRGRKLASGRRGGYDTRLMEVTLERHGLVPNQDVTLIPIGNQTDRYNALKIGMVDGISVNPPVNLALQGEGFREIYDLADLNIAGVYISLITSRHLLQERPRVAERFLAAMMEATAYARVNREHTIQVMSDYLKLTDQVALSGAYDAYAGDALAIPPYVPLDGVQAVIDETLKEAPIAQVKEAALMVDNRPLQAVEASGFTAAMLADYPRR